MKIIINNTYSRGEIEISENGGIEEYMDAIISSLFLDTFTRETIVEGMEYGIYKLTNKKVE